MVEFYKGDFKMDRKGKKAKSVAVKSPYDRREEAITEKAFKSTEKSVKPVAKDTNKTRRPRKKPL
jgi:hypothetical protein